MGIALLLTGIGFLVLTLGGLERKERHASGADSCTARPERRLRSEARGRPSGRPLAFRRNPQRESVQAPISLEAERPTLSEIVQGVDHMSQKKRIRRLAAALAAAAGAA